MPIAWRKLEKASNKKVCDSNKVKNYFESIQNVSGANWVFAIIFIGYSSHQQLLVNLRLTQSVTILS